MGTDWTEDWDEPELGSDIPALPLPQRRAHAVHDAEQAPPPEICHDCGAAIPWVWWTPRVQGYASRWLAPTSEVCSGCLGAREAKEAEAALYEAQRAAGVPLKYRPYRWDNFIKQHKGEDQLDFVGRVKGAGPNVVGITHPNWSAAIAFRGWYPGCGYSLYLHGKVGLGKTLFASMTATKLLQAPLELVEVPYERLSRRQRQSVDRGAKLPWARRGGYVVRFLQEKDLQRDVDDRRTRRFTGGRERSEHPMKIAGRVQCLFLDDLGTANQEAKGWRASMETLIDTRYRRNLDTVITSNVPWEKLGAHYGSERLASRLEEMCTQDTPNGPVVHAYHLDGWYDWRRLKAEAKARPPPELPMKTSGQ